MDAIFDVAPPATWIRVVSAGTLLLAGFVLLSHVLVHKDAYGRSFHGPAARGSVESLLRWGSALVLAGLGVWGWELGWAGWVLATLTTFTVVVLGLEAVAAARS